MKNLIFVYKSSYGELLAGLPFLMKLKSSQIALNYIFIYQDEEAFEKIPTHFKELIFSNFKIVKITKKTFMPFFLKHFLSKSLIVTCDGGHTRFSTLLSMFGLRTRVAFFSHAYALLGSKIDEKVLKNFSHYKRRLGGHHHQPLIVAHGESEKKYRLEFAFLPQNIITAGYLGYKKEWISLLNELSEDISKLDDRKRKFDKTIFIPTRDVHPSYLTKDNSDYLLSSLKYIVERFPDYLFLIKMHPRQSNKEEFNKLLGCFDNVEFIDISAISAGELADISVSYWSSAISDVIAADGIAVEFFRHNVFHTQLVEEDNRLVSLYHHCGLCPFYEKKEDVIELLASPEKWEQIKKEQQKVFGELFLLEDSNFVSKLEERFKRTPFRYKYFIEMPFYSLKILILTIRFGLKKSKFLLNK